jgi:hypothetical protein
MKNVTTFKLLIFKDINVNSLYNYNYHGEVIKTKKAGLILSITVKFIGFVKTGYKKKYVGVTRRTFKPDPSSMHV